MHGPVDKISTLPTQEDEELQPLRHQGARHPGSPREKEVLRIKRQMGIMVKALQRVVAWKSRGTARTQL